MSFTETLHSYVLTLGLPVLAVLLFSFLPIRRWRARIPSYVVVFTAALAISFFLRPGNSTVESTAEANSLLASGQPVFVEFFANTCPLCLASEPAVKSLESEIAGRAQVIRLNIQEDLALPLMREFDAFSTPTFVVLDETGQVMWRQTGSVLDKARALEALGLS